MSEDRCCWENTGQFLQWSLYRTQCGADAKLCGNEPGQCFRCGKQVLLCPKTITRLMLEGIDDWKEEQ